VQLVRLVAGAATGSALAAGYILNGLFAPDSVINTWQLTLLDLGFVRTGLSLRINAVFLLGAVILFSVKAIQDGAFCARPTPRRFSHLGDDSLILIGWYRS